jgi:hypothetical protein
VHRICHLGAMREWHIYRYVAAYIICVEIYKVYYLHKALIPKLSAKLADNLLINIIN